MDYVLVLPSTKHGNDCVFVVLDHFSKMAIMTACKKSITIEATAKLFFEHVWVHLGYHRLSFHIGTTCSWAHFGLAYGHLWTPNSPNQPPSTPKPMDKQRWPIGWLCILWGCTILNIPTHGMLIFHMFNITTTMPFIALLATILSRCARGSNHWPQLM